MIKKLMSVFILTFVLASCSTSSPKIMKSKETTTNGTGNHEVSSQIFDQKPNPISEEERASIQLSQYIGHPGTIVVYQMYDLQHHPTDKMIRVVHIAGPEKIRYTDKTLNKPEDQAYRGQDFHVSNSLIVKLWDSDLSKKPIISYTLRTDIDTWYDDDIVTDAGGENDTIWISQANTEITLPNYPDSKFSCVEVTKKYQKENKIEKQYYAHDIGLIKVLVYQDGKESVIQEATGIGFEQYPKDVEAYKPEDIEPKTHN